MRQTTAKFSLDAYCRPPTTVCCCRANTTNSTTPPGATCRASLLYYVWRTRRRGLEPRHVVELQLAPRKPASCRLLTPAYAHSVLLLLVLLPAACCLLLELVLVLELKLGRQAARAASGSSCSSGIG